MASWTAKAKKIAAGKWIKFDSAQPQHILVFVGEPKEVEKTSQMGPTKGEVYYQMSFPVLEDGNERILEPNRSLLVQLIEEDEEESIIGAEFLIKCLNPEKRTQWKLKRIAGVGSGIESYTKPAAQPAERAQPEETEAAQEEEASKDKEKFMEEVKKVKAKKQKKPKAEPAPEA